MTICCTRFVLLFCIVVLTCLAQEPQSSPPFRVRVDRVNVGVTVTDSAGNFVEGLKREDFRVFDNGVEQPITDFLSIDEPAQLLLLVEAGPAVFFLSKNHLFAADQLLTSLAANDRVAIASYTRTPQVVLGLTEDKLAARTALQAINFNNGFGDLDLSQSLATALDGLAAIPGKKTLVLLSTGVDFSSPAAIEAAHKKLLSTDVRVLAVSLSTDFRNPAKRKKLSLAEQQNRAQVREGFERADDTLLELTSLTGGRVYFPADVAELNRVYAEAAKLIRHEYSLAFSPPEANGELHSIRVELNRPGVKLEHRQAYVAPST